MNCDTPLPWIRPRAYEELKEPAGSPAKPWFCQDPLIPDEEAKRKRWCWEERGGHLPPRLESYWLKQIVRIERANECFEIH